MNINFTKRALRRLNDIHSYIAENNPEAAKDSLVRIDQTVSMLESFPLLGRVGRVEKTRELAVSGQPFLIIYELSSEMDVTILTVIHARQKYPPK